MDQLRICSDFLKKAIGSFISKKAKKYVNEVTISNLQIDKQQDGNYKMHVNCDICVTEDQVSQFLHGL